MTEEKLQAIEAIYDKYGESAIFRLGSDARINVEPLPTGSALLNKALGIGGWPVGRIIEIYGPESSGKTTLATHAIAEAQKLGKRCAFVDAEHAMDPLYTKAIGVNLDELFVSQPDYGEQALDIVLELARTGEFQLIIVDSIAALTPLSEIEGDMTAASVGTQARMMSKGMRKISAIANKHGVTIIFINQLREKIGVMFGNPETTPGGRAVRFYASVRVDIRPRLSATDRQVEAGETIGNNVHVKIAKNKVAAPFKETDLTIIYGEGISAELSLLDAGLNAGIIKKSGAWLSYNGENFAQGRVNARNKLKEDKELFTRISDTLESLC